MSDSVGALVEDLFRREAGRLAASLTRMLGPARLALVEDVVQETLVRALSHWSFHGAPENPPAWLARAAQNLAIDHLRAERGRLRKEEAYAREGAPADTVPDAALDPDGLPDDELRLLFLCCHPRLSQEAQVTLTLKTLCGFSVAEIARGLLAKETAIAQRLVRARATLRETGTDFSLPPPEALEDRLEPALRVLYLLFNEGYSASEGPDVVRGSLCGDAAYLAGLLAKHPLGDRPEVHALLALMCFHASRLPAREAAGELLLLADQDRGRWDRSAVLRGFHHLERAMRGSRLTDYHLEAGIASCHARAASLAETDWAAVVELYDLLLKRSGSPVVALNRAVAVGMLRGPAAGLAEAELLRDEPALRAYHFLPAVLGDFHARLGNLGEAARHFARAHALTHSVPERTWLQQRVDSLSADSPIPYTLTPTP